MDFTWTTVIDTGVLSAALLIATLLRARLGFLQRYMIPNAITAGFLLLPLYNYLFPLIGYGTNNLGELVYHLLNISFVAMILRAPVPKKAAASGGVLGMTTGILAQYALQALTGLMLTLALIATVTPSLSPAFGLLLPLGFSLGPGQAYAIGRGWEAMGFAGAGSVGLTIAAIGYLWACFMGISMIHYGIRKGWMSQSAAASMNNKTLLTGVVPRGQQRPVGSRLTTESEAIDGFSLHIAIVAGTYLLAYLFLSGLSWLLAFAGGLGEELATNLWGINFIFSALTAHVVRFVMVKVRVEHVLDDDTLSRISGFAVDYMVVGAIAAISMVFVGQYWVEILVVTGIGGGITTLTVPWMASRMFRDHRFERMMMIYGCSTGTLTTGLALLRIVDPYYRTPAAPDYMVSAGLTFLLAIPFILAINLPARAGVTGNMGSFWLMIAICVLYLLVSLGLYVHLARRRSVIKPKELWHAAEAVPGVA